MSKTKDLIAVSTKIAGSGLAVMVLSHLTNDPKLASSLGTLGIGAYAATESAKLFIGLAPNFIVNWCQQAKDVKNHDKNHDIENALRQAYTKTILHIEDDFISENELEESYLHLIKRKVGLSNAEQNKKKVLHEYFFEKLIQHFTDENELAHFIGNNEQLDLGAYLEKVFFESLIDANWDVTLGNEFKIDELVLYFKERFVKYFPQNFVQEIKHNEKAKTAYFKILLELSIARISEVKQDTENLLWSTEQIQSTLELLNLIAIRTDNNLAQLLESQLKDSAVLHSLTPLIPQLSQIARSLEVIIGELAKEKCWVPNLVLSQQREAKDKANIFEYNTRYTPFTGRTNEMAELFTFLDTPDRFSWWMVEGLGGMGKSRLAMEFCTLAKAQGYYAGFYKLDNSVLPDNDKLLSGKLPILMVIDYAMSNMAKTIEVLSFIQDKVNTAATYGASAPKIRVLLLDRKFSKEWFSSVSYIKAYVYQPENHPTLQLSKDSEDIRWRIIEQVLNKEDESEEQLLLAKFSARKSEIMNALDNLDVEKRPLYAFFATEALIYDPKRDIKNWNVHSLLDFHLHRLKNRIWAKKQGYLDHEFWVVKLLALNTLARSLTKEEISDFLRANSDLSTSEQKVVKETYYSIAEYQLEDGAYTFYGLQPDILGRIFYFDSV